MIARTICRIVAVFVLAMCGLSLAAAEETLLQRSSELISSPNVAQDMRLSQSQATQVSKLFAGYQTDRGALVARMQDVREDQRNPLMAELGQLTTKLHANLLAILNPAQLERLEQIGIQREGSVALVDETVAREVGLTEAQRTKIAIILTAVERAQEDYQAALGEAIVKIPEPGSGEAAMQAYDAKQKAVIASMKPRFNQFIAVKTAGNKQIYTLMTPAQRE